MSRPLFMGNGSMLVGLDKTASVHDFYYPYVGMEDHTNELSMHHRIGVYVDDEFVWLDSGEWDIKMDYELDAQVGATTAVNSRLQIALEMHDFVDYEYNAWCRNIHVVNNADRDRNVRVFMHQAFRISESLRGDTAMYEPEGNYILDYKGRRCFIVYGEKSDGESFDQYSVGIAGIEGKEGTYEDALDGELSNHPIEHGSVDSTIRFNFDLPAHCSKRYNYWIVASSNHADALKIHKELLGPGFNERYKATQHHWHHWINHAKDSINTIPHALQTPLKKSMLILKSHIDKRGAVIASGDSEMLNYSRDNYSYCWPRDAAFVLWPLIRLGYQDEPKAYFEFARDVLSENGSMMHKYQPDRAIGSTWHPLVHKGDPELAIQEDETAITVFMLYQYLLTSDDEDFVERMYETLVKPAATFMETFIDEQTSLPHASYDLWEEKFATHTFTVAITYAGLKSAAKMAERFEHPGAAIRWQTVADEIRIAAQKHLYNEEKGFFHKSFLADKDGMTLDETIDISSLYGAVMFDLFDADGPEIQTSLKTIEETLLNKSPSGGLPRYEDDNYYRANFDYKGNPWFVSTLWLAQIYNELGMPEKAKPLLEWSQAKMTKSGVLSEQIDPVTNEFMSVAPLIWSQSEFINTVLDLSD